MDSDSINMDKISDLPDFIIGYILSFLPTRVAVRTSVLSKRWIHLWKLITYLDLTDLERYYKNPHFKYCSRKVITTPHFKYMVYRVLRLINTSKIQSFSLSLTNRYAPQSINKLISDIFNRKVIELYIDSDENPNFSRVFLLEPPSLEVLVLKGCKIIFSTHVSLSSLTYLELSNVMFPQLSDSVTLNFPLLTHYEAKNCFWCIRGVTFEVPLLEVISINNIGPSESFISPSTIKFRGSRLIDFSCSGHISPRIKIVLDMDLSIAKIASANIQPRYIRDVHGIASSSLLLLEQLNNNVQCLTFGWPELLAQQNLPSFGMLTRLELDSISGETLIHLLRSTPVLHTLCLKELLEFKNHEDIMNPDHVPDCFLSSLRVVFFGVLNGYEHELCFTKYVMENTKVLESITFGPDWSLTRDKTKFYRVRTQILSFGRSVTFQFIGFSSRFLYSAYFTKYI